ncbi:MAG: FtsK/SpoIIIE domain-containing protein [Chloroflexota bacterium]
MGRSHILVGGESGSGKSTWLNTMLVALLMAHTPQELQVAIVDPKQVEFQAYAGIPHLFAPIATEVDEAAALTARLLAELDCRRALFAGVLARDLAAYNRVADEPLPLLLLIVDEVTDIALQAGLRSAFYTDLIRLVSKGRAFGLVVVLATQNSKAEVLNTLIRGNLSTRIAFRVTTAEHARTSGVDGTRWRIDGGDWNALGSSSPWSFDVNNPADGSHTVGIYAADVAGNSTQSTPLTRNFNVDNTPPGGSVTINNGAAWTDSRSVTLHLSASDPSPGSGVTQMCFRNDGESWSGWEPYATTRSGWQLRDAEGERTVYVKYRDAAGNESNESSDTIVLDQAPPGDWDGFSPLGWTNNLTPTVSIEVRDLGVGLAVSTAQHRFSTDGGVNWSGWLAASCTGSDGTTFTQTITATVPFGQDSGMLSRVQFRIEDQMGRLGTSGAYTVQINSSAPGGWSNFSPVGWVADHTPTVSVQVRDAAPGLDVGSAVCEYSTDDRQSWNTVSCTCTGSTSTTLTQTITAAAVPFSQDSGTLNWVRFSISDTSGYRGDSDAYPVYIDTTGPEAQISAPRRMTTPTIPITWTASDGAGSGVAGYDVQVRVDPSTLRQAQGSGQGGEWQRLLTDTQATSYEYAGEYGHSYTFRVQATDNVGNPGDWVEATTAVVQVTKYYHFNGQRIAMRQGSVVYYLHGDHLGSTSLATTAAGAVHSRQGYYPYGETRYTAGELPTDFHFTGQRNDATIGLYDYHARFYAPALGRFLSADTIIPNPAAPQSFNRYSYVLGNPLKYTDPSGHYVTELPGGHRPNPPIWQAMRDFLNHPYIKPLWTNPQIGVPVVYGIYREVRGDATEALSLTVDWYFERGDEIRILGDESEITQHLIRDEGVQEARAAFKEGGGKDMVGIDKDAYEHKFDSEFFIETPKAVFNDDWSGSFLGGYYVEFRNQEGYDGPGRLVEVRVINDTGWQSGTRIPFTSHSTRENEPRFSPGPGGTLWQYYTWMEVIYVDETN